MSAGAPEVPHASPSRCSLHAIRSAASCGASSPPVGWQVLVPSLIPPEFSLLLTRDRKEILPALWASIYIEKDYWMLY